MEPIKTADRETIIYRGQKYHRYPNSPRRQLRVYFWRHDTWKESPKSLHRQIWIDNFGEIPEKFHVHHKDGDTFNNELSNLALISPSDHASKHAKEPERVTMSRKNIKKANIASKVWHASKEGKAWHKEHAKKIWDNPKTYTKICERCKKIFTAFQEQTRFCGPTCSHYIYMQKRNGLQSNS